DPFPDPRYVEVRVIDGVVQDIVWALDPNPVSKILQRGPRDADEMMPRTIRHQLQGQRNSIAAVAVPAHLAVDREDERHTTRCGQACNDAADEQLRPDK